MALVRDPFFWKRFSRAVHLDDEIKTPQEEKQPSIWSDDWLHKQRRKRRKSVWCGFAICVSISILIAGIAFAIWWFCAHNWLRGDPTGESVAG
ncbi:hypothetical protein BDV19DRAFT_393222 [Aspergillus venezuelensis]